MRGDGTEPPPHSSPTETVAVAAVAVLVAGGLTSLTSALEMALLLGTFAASSLPVFAYPDVPFSQRACWTFLLFPTLAGAGLIVVVALGYHNLRRDVRWPKYWS